MKVGIVALFVAVPLNATLAQSNLLARAEWMAGCWELRVPNRVTLEMWMPPLGDVMLGASRTTVGTTTTEFEHIRLRADSGRLVYTALPSGQREASFPSISVADTLIVFENSAHDFPQRITYRRRGTDSLIAMIEGPGQSGPRRVTYAMRRASCTSIAPPAPPDTVVMGADLAPDGRHLVVARGAAPEFDLYLLAGDGTLVRRLTTTPNFDYQPRWSPDGRRIAFAGVRGRAQQVHTMNADGSELRELTNGSQNSEPAWSPDGQWIAFRSERDGNPDIYVMRADGSGQRALTTDARAETMPAWSPDGTQLLFSAVVDGRTHVFVMAADGSGQRQLSQSPTGHSRAAHWSPDGRQVVFSTNRDGNEEVYVMNADGSGAKNVSNHPAADLAMGWTRDGDILFLSTRDRAARDVYRMKPDGSGVVRVTRTP